MSVEEGGEWGGGTSGNRTRKRRGQELAMVGEAKDKQRGRAKRCGRHRGEELWRHE